MLLHSAFGSLLGREGGERLTLDASTRALLTFNPRTLYWDLGLDCVGTNRLL